MKNNGVDYKKKYEDLRARFIQALDVAYRSGYEQGMNEAQVQMAAEQAQQQAQMQAQMQGQMMSGMGQVPSSPGAEEATGPESPEMPGQSSDELDHAIGQLEQLVNKSDLSSDDLKKSLELIKSEHMHKKMTKKTKSIDITPKQMIFSQSYKHNLPENSKASVSMQEKIVDDILRKWEQEESKTSNDITKLLGTEALTKKE